MKVRVCTLKEVVVEIPTATFAELDNYYRTHAFDEWDTPFVEEMTDKAIKEIEEKMGIPFGNDNVEETICSVSAMDGEVILEW